MVGWKPIDLGFKQSKGLKVWSTAVYVARYAWDIRNVA